MKVFLGGTCNNTKWREELIPLLTVPYFNPVVEDWTDEMIAIEEDEKDNQCDIHLYVITRSMTGVFSIAEAVQSSNTVNKKCVFQVIPNGFDKFQLKSLTQVGKLIEKNGGIFFMEEGLDKLAATINMLGGNMNEN